LKTFGNYLSREVHSKTIIVLLGFMALFLVFDLVSEMKEIGSNGYGLRDAMWYSLLRVPSAAYGVLPIACLIGGLWAFSLFSSSSEFSIARASGMTPWQAARRVALIGSPFVLLCVLLSEVVVPFSEARSQDVRLFLSSPKGPSALNTGYWLRDPLGRSDDGIQERVLNLGGESDRRGLKDIRVYEFDVHQRLVRVLDGESLAYEGPTNERAGVHIWRLSDVYFTEFSAGGGVAKGQLSSLSLPLGLSPLTIESLMAKPEQMSALDTWIYIEYLRSSGQAANRYELSLWKKLVYPVLSVVMLLLALPSAYILVRQGGVSARVFLGILIGVAFHLLNSLFSHLGILNAWPAPLVAVIPSGLALLLALAMLARVQRG
jgi:lipopolysaccharide export system permease protein